MNKSWTFFFLYKKDAKLPSSVNGWNQVEFKGAARMN